MGHFHQFLVSVRRAFLVVGWGLVIAQVALVAHASIRAKLDAPATLARRAHELEDDSPNAAERAIAGRARRD